MTEQNLNELKAQADSLGIKYSPNISAVTLKQRIENYEPNTDSLDNSKDSLEQIKLEATRLIRCQVTPMDKAKSNYEGEIFTVGNAHIPTIKKFVAFNKTTHIPKMMFDMIKEKEMISFYTDRSEGKVIKRAKFIKAYGVIELPPLTEEELEALAKAQQARNSIE